MATGTATARGGAVDVVTIAVIVGNSLYAALVIALFRLEK